ncbi:unnamed protein product [Symbiodinium sp. CCMP2592]|nr:unnamed protein product [Symbiodinium sp. CCMP2592]CAE7834446.1 unnamed protein product [Symbiodinium sp. CCMP2592]
MAGWDSCAADLLRGRLDANQQPGASEAEAPAEAGEVVDEADAPWNSRKSRRIGNRTNRFGSKVFRAALREVSLESPEQGERRAVQQGRGQQHAIVRALQRGAAQGCSAASDTASSTIQAIMSVGTHLRQKVALLAAKHFGWRTEKSAAALSGVGDEASTRGKLDLLDEDSCKPMSAEVVETVTERLLFSYGTRPQTALVAEAEKLSISKDSLRNKLLEVASAVQLASTQAWNMWLHRMQQLEQEKIVKCLLSLTSRTYDETPLKVNVSQAQGSASSGVGSIAKILQTRLKVGWLYEVTDPDHQEFGKMIFVHGWVPTQLQILERTTAKDISKAQLDILAEVSDGSIVMPSGCFQVSVASADRYSANGAAERAITSKRVGETPLRLPCLVHMASGSSTWMLHVVEEHVSAMVAAGLVIGQLSGYRALRKLLGDEICSMLVLCDGDAPGGDVQSYRVQVYDTYLSLNLSGEDTISAWRQKRAVQRAILDRFICGNLQDTENVFFFTKGVPMDRETAMHIVRRHIVPALLPGPIRVFPRHRWFGGELCIDGLGLLAAHHGLLQRVLLKLTKDVVSAPPVSSWQTLLQASGWDGAVENLVAEYPQADEAENADAEEPVVAVEAAPQVSAADMAAGASLDWATLNRSFKKKLRSWAETADVHVLSLMRSAMTVIVTLLQRFLARAKSKWDLQQQRKMASTGSRSYRLTEIFLGRDILEALVSLQVRFRQEIAALPVQSRNMQNRVLAFKLFARAAGAIHWFLRRQHDKCPYLVFGLLDPVSRSDVAGRLEKLPLCMRDAFTHEFLQRYPKSARMTSKKALHQLHGIALLADVDISTIECRHAAVRRILMARSTSKQVGVEVLSADYLCRQMDAKMTEMAETLGILQHQREMHGILSIRQKRKKRKQLEQKKKKKPKRTGGGGRQRAFFRARLRGRKFSGYAEQRTVMRQLHQELRHLSRAENQEFARLGWFGTLSHRAGNPSFGLHGPAEAVDPPGMALAALPAAQDLAVSAVCAVVQETKSAQKEMVLREASSELQLQAALSMHVAEDESLQRLAAIMPKFWPEERYAFAADVFPSVSWNGAAAEVAQA